MVSILLGSTLCRYQRSRTFNHSYIIKTLLNINVLKNWMAYVLHSRHSWYFFGTKQPQCLPEFWAQKKRCYPALIVTLSIKIQTWRLQNLVSVELKHWLAGYDQFRSVKFVFYKKITFDVSGTQQRRRPCRSAQTSPAVVFPLDGRLEATSYMAITRASEECVLNYAPTVSHMFGPTRAPRPARPADGRQRLRRLRRRIGPVCRSSVPNQGG